MSSSDASDDADIRVLCGPTAAGKTAIALWLAERYPIAIISADSRQIYRGFDVGTAKPSPADRGRIPHFGIDVVDPTERYSSVAWADAAEMWIDESIITGQRALIVGGSGFYLRSLFQEFFVEPPIEASRRDLLQRYLAALPRPELTRWALALDAERARLGRSQLLRAIEIALLTGRRLSDLHRQQTRPPRRRARYLVVDRGAALIERICGRVEAMLETGWEDEVARLAIDVPDNAPAWNAAGYGFVRRLVSGEIRRADAVRAIVAETRQYAKRQRTWFRHQLPSEHVTRLDPSAPEFAREVNEWWADEGDRVR